MKRSHMITATLLAAAPMLLAAETPPSPSHWAMAVNSGDKATIARLYTDDAVLVSPAMEIVAAPAAIGEFWLSKRRSGAADFHIVSVNERRDGDTLYQSAAWTTTFGSKKGASVLEGQMTNVFARQPDGSWKIRLQTWN